MPRLVACPFCRELFADGEVPRCPSCDIPLTDLRKLPSQPDEDDDDFGIPSEPHREPLPLFFLGRGRGLLLLLCLLGLAAFFLPWVNMRAPELQVLSGADLARRSGWIFSAAVGWFVLLPLVLSRRSVEAMRGARVAAAMLSAVPAVTSAILMLFPPQPKYVPLAFSWGVGIWANLLVGIAGVLVSLRFGGRLDDLPARGRGPSNAEELH